MTLRKIDGMVKITLRAADAGYLELQTSTPDISAATRLLCAQFQAHYMEKGVGTEIEFEHLPSAIDYHGIAADINETALRIRKGQA